MKFRILILALFVFVCAGANAQQNLTRCETNRNAPPIGRYFWPPDSEVNVFFQRGEFTLEQVAALRAAMDFWSHSGASNGSGVSFKFAGEINEPMTCTSCLIVSRQNIRKQFPKYLAYFLPVSFLADGQLFKAWIVLDERTTRPDVLQTFMAHELGHGLGLWDCPKCKKKATLMKAFWSVNKVGQIMEPSFCDVAVVRDVYQQRRLVAGK